MSPGKLLQVLCLLWLAGMAMRIIILAVPPVIPLIRDELGIPLILLPILAPRTARRRPPAIASNNYGT